MKRYFTSTFVKFVFGFLAIIAVAFAVVIVFAPTAAPIDNVALPR